jgi:hypothetical protein
VYVASRDLTLRTKLLEAMEQSQELRRRTTQLLELSTEMATVWMNGRSARRPRRDTL